ncbi:MAG: DegT/DnrJ/EryC1/StrS family aminotransferase [Okeania sp. SIO3B5]|uniref:DegT/DnrJ/EryC1/StrS family aminotransferase n=1 Tax=Okeania sp. SIO3B5 TaxID=2607811 RepID=UPI001400F718|nr:DegT/DnrJ/EryC1/StrS family aminotransferase [Okeania sp. SIO3B5]NEO52977.1 DegT/DnrJ/EryC1/StrS family aminotransferase [Okeania sp. SIO3B5]
MEHQESILQTNPKVGYLAHKAEIDAAVARVLDSGWYILGSEVEAFEKEFASYIGVSHAVGVANGTDALEIALRACGIGAGDLVITVSHTAVATVAAIELVGVTPVLVDIDPITFTMDVNCLEETVVEILNSTSPPGRLKAIIPVHLYGHPADMTAIMDIADRYQLYVIEDCAQSHGATIEGRKTGCWGHLAAFSFYPTKNLGALGDGGAVTTSDEVLAEKVLTLRQYGWRQRFISDVPGMNTRLDPMQAAILRVKLQYLDGDNQQRQHIAEKYDGLLANIPWKLPKLQGNIDHVYHQYVVRGENRDDIRGFLKEKAIGTAIHYPSPVHLQPAYRDRLPIGSGGLETTEKIGKEIFSLPMYPQLGDDGVRRIGEAIALWYQQKGGDK